MESEQWTGLKTLHFVINKQAMRKKASKVVIISQTLTPHPQLHRPKAAALLDIPVISSLSVLRVIFVCRLSSAVPLDYGKLDWLPCLTDVPMQSCHLSVDRLSNIPEDCRYFCSVSELLHWYIIDIRLDPDPQIPAAMNTFINERARNHFLSRLKRANNGESKIIDGTATFNC